MWEHQAGCVVRWRLDLWVGSMLSICIMLLVSGIIGGAVEEDDKWGQQQYFYKNDTYW